ncbi:Cytochrome P450 [Streptomyces sp. Ncost-T6T-1]|uniref:cytochrome P450 n=1 Tax=Streptomyces sp. Ncost-T6T-1 TaxID=1100828 RepID=UPI000804FCDB|nr:cytochrome P450 [Streptomyces sp. Ncost-T6T-1]SBU91135.1 Cytochrome P450 [Streptomyces sp. Ncost-T6T-1]
MTIPTELDLTDPTAFVRHDAHEFWRQVRMSRPVYWHEGDPGFWVVSRHADVLACYADVRSLSSARGTVLEVLLSGGDSAGGKMLAVTDRPRHRELRNLMLRAFSPRVLGAVEQGVRERASRLVRSVTGQGGFDFATEVAEHIPMQTICDLLSIPEADRGKLLRWNKLALSSEDAQSDRLDSLEARNEIVGYFMDLAQHRRGDPGDDVVSMIATAEVGDRPLTLEEVALNCYSLVLGGDESSRVSAICAVKAFAEHPDQWRALRAGTVAIDTAVEEVLRWATPAMHFARTATRDMEISGRPVREGDIVTLWNTSANNDEEVFDQPRRFDPARSPNKHLSFGHGPHFCVGAFLGRAELRALLSALIGSVTEIEVCGEPTPIFSNFLNGYAGLPVAFR